MRACTRTAGSDGGLQRARMSSLHNKLDSEDAPASGRGQSISAAKTRVQQHQCAQCGEFKTRVERGALQANPRHARASTRRLARRVGRRAEGVHGPSHPRHAGRASGSLGGSRGRRHSRRCCAARCPAAGSRPAARWSCWRGACSMAVPGAPRTDDSTTQAEHTESRRTRFCGARGSDSAHPGAYLCVTSGYHWVLKYSSDRVQCACRGGY